MTLVNVNPRRTVRRSNSIFDNLFNELISPNHSSKMRNQLVNSRPNVNIIETGDGFKIELSAPGLSKKDFAIDINKDLLTISATREVKEKEGEQIIKREFDFSNFKRTFRLPETIDTTKIDARFKNGILSLDLSKKEEAKELPPRTVEIK